MLHYFCRILYFPYIYILKWILKEQGVDWIHLAQDRIQWRAYEHGNEHSGSIKDGKFLNQLSDY